MEVRKDLTGQRFGRLVAIRPVRKRANDDRHTMWFCKCDCGSVAVISTNNLIQQTVSCGCVSRGPKIDDTVRAVCPGCGEKFDIELNGQKTPQFCPDCSRIYTGNSWKVCPVCRKLFKSFPSAKKTTCSEECSKKWGNYIRTGRRFKWSEKSKKAARESGLWDDMDEAAARARARKVGDPRFERTEENITSKIWVLVDPSGNEHIVRNLKLWASENYEKFGKDDSERSIKQIAQGFYMIALSLRGKKAPPRLTYFGWTLKNLPRELEDNKDGLDQMR